MSDDDNEPITQASLAAAFRENIEPKLEALKDAKGSLRLKVTSRYSAPVQDADGRVVGELVKAD